MSNLTPGDETGLRQQRGVRSTMRLGGGVLTVGGLALLGQGLYDFVAVDGTGMPSKFWMVMVGIPMLGIGLMLLNLGFASAQVRMMRGLLEDSKSCRSCGRRNDTAARFCDACGASMG